MSTPSSSTVVARGVIEPGAVPPTSAWWPREATQNRIASPVVVEDRRADRDVGEMRAAVIGRVQREDVARAGCRPSLRRMIGLDRAVHRAEMDRHVRRVGDEAAVAVEDRAGEVEPLLDVHRIGGVLERHAHLLGDRHEEVVEHFEHHRIGVGADRGALRAAAATRREHDMVPRRHLGLPAGLDDDRLVRLDDQRRAGDRRAAAARCSRRWTPASCQAPSE